MEDRRYAELRPSLGEGAQTFTLMKPSGPQRKSPKLKWTVGWPLDQKLTRSNLVLHMEGSRLDMVVVNHRTGSEEVRMMTGQEFGEDGRVGNAWSAPSRQSRRCRRPSSNGEEDGRSGKSRGEILGHEVAEVEQAVGGRRRAGNWRSATSRLVGENRAGCPPSRQLSELVSGEVSSKVSISMEVGGFLVGRLPTMPPTRQLAAVQAAG
ncbi:hypothetical protein Dimus_026909 [Dionaea muscipula]